MTFAKYAKYFLWAIMAISVLFIGLFYFGGIVDGTEGPNPEPVITNTLIQYSYILFFVSVIGAIGFSIMNIFSNPKSMKNIAIVVICAAVVFLASRGMASDKIIEFTAYKGTDNVPGVLKNVGTGLYATYILLGATVVAMLYSEISKLFK